MTLSCIISANPSVTSVTWYRVINIGLQPIVIGSSTKYSGGSLNTPDLTINRVVVSDGGTYRCSATNGVGTGTSPDISLTVVGREWDYLETLLGLNVNRK